MNKTRGFTLIELLIVIAIIGIVFMVVASAFGKLDGTMFEPEYGNDAAIAYAQQTQREAINALAPARTESTCISGQTFLIERTGSNTVLVEAVDSNGDSIPCYQ